MTDQNHQQPDGALDHALDELLTEFGQHVAAQSQLGESERSQLTDRIMHAASETRAVCVGRRKNVATRRTLVAAGLSLCLLLLVVAKPWRSTVEPIKTPEPFGPSTPVFVERHCDQMRAVAEHEQVFGLPLAWYVERDDQVRFQLADDSDDAENVSKHRPVFVELRVEKIEGGLQARQSQDETLFLMTRGERPVELPGEHSAQPKLLFWLCPVDENLFAYELAMHENNGTGFSGETVGLIEADKPEQPLTLEQNGAEYRVYLQIHTT